MATASTHRTRRTEPVRALSADVITPAYSSRPPIATLEIGRFYGSNSRMKDTQHHHRQRLPRPIRVMRARPRLFLSAFIGLLVIAALPAEWKLAARLLIGWDVGVALYLIAVYQ